LTRYEREWIKPRDVDLVHLYWQVDNRRVYQVIQDNLADLDAFRQQVLAWLRP